MADQHARRRLAEMWGLTVGRLDFIVGCGEAKHVRECRVVEILRS